MTKPFILEASEDARPLKLARQIECKRVLSNGSEISAIYEAGENVYVYSMEVRIYGATLPPEYYFLLGSADDLRKRNIAVKVGQHKDDGRYNYGGYDCCVSSLWELFDFSEISEAEEGACEAFVNKEDGLKLTALPDCQGNGWYRCRECACLSPKKEQE